MTYGEAFRLIEQLRPRGRWSMGVETTIVKGEPVTSWKFYQPSTEVRDVVMLDDIPSAEALVDAVRSALSTAATTIESVGDADV